MPIQMQCPNPACARAARLADEYRGHWVRCPACHHKFQVPTDASLGGARATHERVLAETLPTTSPGRPPRSSAPTLPAQVGRFLIRERLGAGAFGAVYRALDPHLQREVALKVPHPGSLDSPHHIERFLREGRAAAGLCHPHIVPVYDAGRDGPHHYIASAFVPGRTLAAAVADGPLDCRRAAELVRQLAEALAYAHGRGVVHRDVKPANVMLDEHGEAHLMDFGLAHRGEGTEKLTQDGAVLGTPAYMAPEQAAGQQGDPLPASDQYGLGAVLYELLTGVTPFSGPPAIVLYTVLHRDPEPPRTVNAAVPADLETVCLKALAKRPQDRYANCQELANDLRRWLEGEAVRARRLGVAERCLRWVKREPRLAALAAITVGCLLVGSVLATAEAGKLRDRKSETASLVEKAAEQQRMAVAKEKEAREQTETARSEAKKEDSARREAETRRGAARAAEQRQQDQTRIALKAEQEVKAEEKKTRLVLYEADLEIAERALKRSDPGRAYTLLTRQQPAPGQGDLRDARWHGFWKRLPAPLTAAEHEALLTCVVLSPDGMTIASGSGDQMVRLWTDAVALKGHTDGVDSVCFSPDGKRLASAGGDLIRVWDAHSGQEQLSLKGPGGASSVCFSPDGKRLASATGRFSYRPGEVKVWDARSGQQTLKGDFGRISDVCFSPDGKRLAAGNEGGTVKLWDARTGKEVRALKGHTNWVSSVTFSPDGQYLVSGSYDKTVKVWDALTGQETLSLQGHTNVVSSVCFSPDGKHLASASWDRTVKVWDTATGQATLSLQGHTGSVTRVCFSPDGKRLASASEDRTVRVWDTATGQQTLPPKGHPWTVASVCFSPDGKRLASGGAGAIVRVWEVAARPHQTILPDHTDTVTAVVFNRPGTLLASAAGRTVILWKGKNLVRRLTLGDTSATIRALAFSLDDTTLATGSTDAAVQLWDAHTGEIRATLAGHKRGVTCVAISPDARTVASGSTDRTVKLWDVTTGKELATLAGHPGPVHTLAFSPDGFTLATGSTDKEVRLWDVPGGRRICSLAVDAGEVRSVTFCADGKTLAAAGSDFAVKAWSLAVGKELLTKYEPAILCVALGPGGRLLATGDQQGTVKLWDATTRKEAAILKRTAGVVWGLAFSPDGKTLATGGASGVRLWDIAAVRQRPALDDRFRAAGLAFSPDGRFLAAGAAEGPGAVRLWDVATGTAKGDLSRHKGGVRCVAFSPDGKIVASICAFGEVKLWDLATGSGATLLGHKSGACVVFRSDGKMLVSAGGDGTARQWDVATRKLKALISFEVKGQEGVGLSPDGRLLAVGFADGRIVLWEVATGQATAVLTGHTTLVMLLGFGPDGKTLVSSDRGGTLKVWDVRLLPLALAR